MPCPFCGRYVSIKVDRNGDLVPIKHFRLIYSNVGELRAGETRKVRCPGKRPL
jgi:hypothetical protein